MKNFKVGIQLYGLRSSIAEIGLEKTLVKVKEMGYDYVESAGPGFYKYTVKKAKEILNRTGLSLISAHTRDMSDENLSFLSELGLKNVTISHHALESFTDEWEASLKHFKDSAERAKKYGIRLYYHNHDYEFTNKIGETKIFDKIFDELQGYLTPQIDVCWANYGGSDPIEYIKKYEKSNMRTLHLKDFTCRGAFKGKIYDPFKNGSIGKRLAENLFRFQPVGYGVVDFDGILAAASETSIESVIVEQDESYEMSCIVAAQKSREYLKNNYGI